jgi:signal transduction histidine kinase
MGPAASGYRHKAADIVAQGKRMLAAVDDLDMAARVESRRIAADQGSIDASAMLQRLHADYLPVASDRGVDLAFRIAAKLPPIAGDPVAVERMFTRLLAATISLAEDGEQVLVELNRERDLGGALTLSVARPRVLAGREERVLLDPGYNPEGDWPEAPVLGLGFALRLVRNLAVAAGGRLDIEDNRFVLILPPRRDSAQTGETGA